MLEAGDDVAPLGQQEMPEVAVAAPVVLDGLAGRLAVDVDDERVFLGRVEIGRQDPPAVDLDALADVELEKLGPLPSQGLDLGLEACVGGQGPDSPAVGQPDELGHGRQIEPAEGVKGPTGRR
jgi:hypothetical protein